MADSSTAREQFDDARSDHTEECQCGDDEADGEDRARAHSGNGGWSGSSSDRRPKVCSATTAAWPMALIVAARPLNPTISASPSPTRSTRSGTAGRQRRRRTQPGGYAHAEDALRRRARRGVGDGVPVTVVIHVPVRGDAGRGPDERASRRCRRTDAPTRTRAGPNECQARVELLRNDERGQPERHEPEGTAGGMGDGGRAPEEDAWRGVPFVPTRSAATIAFP